MKGTLTKCVGNAPPILFEPRKGELSSIGTECHEALLTSEYQGCVTVPVEL